MTGFRLAPFARSRNVHVHMRHPFRELDDDVVETFRPGKQQGLPGELLPATANR